MLSAAIKNILVSKPALLISFVSCLAFTSFDANADGLVLGESGINRSGYLVADIANLTNQRREVVFWMMSGNGQRNACHRKFTLGPKQKRKVSIYIVDCAPMGGDRLPSYNFDWASERPDIAVFAKPL